MRTKIAYVGLSILVLLVLSGCGNKPVESASSDTPKSSESVNGAQGNAVNVNQEDNQPTPAASQTASGNNDSGNAAPTKSPEAQKQSKIIDVYYTDKQLMDLVPAKATINYDDKESFSKYVEAFKALQTSEDTELVPLWGKIVLNSIKFEGGQLVLDIHKPIEAQLGAGGEAYALGALTKTMFQFEEVESIELLVDGEKIESLMGHVELEHPMTRSDN